MQAREGFFDLLSEQAHEAVPVHYRLISRHRSGEASIVRISESRHHRAQGYECWHFYKAISRCFPRKVR